MTDEKNAGDPDSGFGKLSYTDRYKLYAASYMDTAAEVIRDDTKERPWKFAFYSLIMMPSPVPAHALIGLGVMHGWSKMRLTEGARRTHDRLKGAFNEQAIMTSYKEFIVPDGAASDRLKVDNVGLLKHSGKKSASDVWQATKHAWGGFRGMFGKKPPAP